MCVCVCVCVCVCACKRGTNTIYILCISLLFSIYFNILYSFILLRKITIYTYIFF